jgi:hypothetical protein
MNKRIVVSTIVLLAGLYCFARATGPASATVANATQDPAGLDRRISVLEQRFYFLESNLRRIEQQQAVRVSPAPEPRADTSALRTEIEALRAQMQLISCALAKLDERTLAPNRRQRANDANSDPCRMNFETPLRLPR